MQQREIEDRIGDIARRQHGLITTAQLAKLGVGPAGVGRRVSAGRLRLVHRGVYQAGPLGGPRARELAAVLACRGSAVLSHRSAAAVWGLAGASGSGGVDVTVSGGQSQSRRGIIVHRARLERGERARLDGIPITSAARTLVDLAGVVRPSDLEQAVALAERRGLVRSSRLATLPARYRGRRGMAALRRILESAEGPRLIRSEGEALVLRLITRARLPQPRTNVRIGDIEVDFYWEEAGVVVELDGRRYHDSASHFETDRQRVAALAARGLLVLPLTWRRIHDDQLATVAELSRALTLGEMRSSLGRPVGRYPGWGPSRETKSSLGRRRESE